MNGYGKTIVRTGIIAAGVVVASCAALPASASMHPTAADSSSQSTGRQQPGLAAAGPDVSPMGNIKCRLLPWTCRRDLSNHP
jgi:hypothetical protein